ncbi:electron transport complex subunit RsxC [Tissierella sp. Yu-01]|uniref:electron transport complex subunit RsxC n=1 Tax=Tissierella sp. Yu-01 TaxID=3035694 RepID=UPI00240E77D8|nr:electron transport complex subunit RsxC [Tissierella sp. Yu-01]WFA09478.1 electron transport complex subunit RsxC [Tissierella sp. Yu-01]
MSMRLDNLTFKGGLHVPDNKGLVSSKAIELAREPKTVYISLQQHVGAPCEALVKVGDNVKVGQKIADSKAKLAAPIHSSVSGVVKGISKMYTTTGIKCDCIEIESDGLNEMHESVGTKADLSKLSKSEIIERIRESGVVGLGGAGYPMHSKLISSEGCSVDTAILNGAECEPYLTCDHRIMLEHPDKVIFGLEVIMKYLSVEEGYIAVENNKMDAIDALKNASKGKNIKVVSLKTKFPQGDSYRIVDAVTGRKVPRDARCKDANSIVSNVHTAYSVAEAILDSKPLYERVITVTGNGIKEPKNLLVKIGTTIGELIEQCGGFNGKPGKIIAGGPMTGMAQFSLDTPIVKTTGGILVLTEEETKVDKVQPCIKCGRCVEVCPVYLEPLYIAAYSLKDNYEAAERYDALACISCGSCSYICPSKRPLTEAITHAKNEIKSKRK